MSDFVWWLVISASGVPLVGVPIVAHADRQKRRELAHREVRLAARHRAQERWGPRIVEAKIRRMDRRHQALTGHHDFTSARLR